MLFWFPVQLAEPLYCNESNNSIFFGSVGISSRVTRYTGHAAMPEEPKQNDKEE